MKKLVFITTIFVLISLFFVNRTYSFQFGFGTKGFIRKTLEKGQQEGKIPRTKEEKEEVPGGVSLSYSGKIDKFDLSQARYLFLAAKSTSTQTSPAPVKRSQSLYHQTGIQQKAMFKIKEDGSIEEVRIYDGEGNRFDVDVRYIVKISTGFISVGLFINGVYITTSTVQVVDGSTQVVTSEVYISVWNWTTEGGGYFDYRKQYLVRIEDGAVFEGKNLPTDPNGLIYEDIYGNYYYIKTHSDFEDYTTTIMDGKILKLNTKDMSIEIMTAENEVAEVTGNQRFFAVDKYGNLAYMYSGNYRYRKTTATIDGSNIEHKGFYTFEPYPYSSYRLPSLVDASRDAIFLVDADYSNLRVRKIECNSSTSYEIKYSSIVGNVSWEIASCLDYPTILNVGDRKVSLMKVVSSIDGKKIVFPTIDLLNATTSYVYEIPFSSFSVTESNLSPAYDVLNSSIVYLMIKTQAQTVGRYRYSFYRIYPQEEKYENIFWTEKYEPSNYWPPFSVDKDGSITMTVTDLDNGTKNIIKITPNPLEPGNPNNVQIINQGKVEIYYLVRVY